MPGAGAFPPLHNPLGRRSAARTKCAHRRTASKNEADIHGAGPQAEYKGTDTIRFKIGGDFIDLLDSLYFTAGYSQTKANGALNAGASGAAADTKARPPNGIAGLIKEIRIRTGTGVEIETIREHNLLHHVLVNYSHMPHADVHEQHLPAHGRRVQAAGHGDRRHGQGYGAAPPDGRRRRRRQRRDIQFPHRVRLPELRKNSPRLDDARPRHRVRPRHQPQSALVEGNETATYKIENPKCIYENAVVSESHRKSLLSFIATNGYVPISFSSFGHQQNNHNSDSQALQFDRSISRLKDIISVFRLASDTTAANRDSLETYVELKLSGGNWRAIWSAARAIPCRARTLLIQRHTVLLHRPAPCC
jgi:hypothetical protein